MKKIKTIAVIGAGTMGSGIVHLFAVNNFNVIMVDKEEALLKKGMDNIQNKAEPMLLAKIKRNITTCIDLNKIQYCDLIIEAVFEDITVKKRVIEKLSNICSKESIVATNTSCISINELSDSIYNPSRFLGLHFMNPPLKMKLVEIIKGENTSAYTLETVISLVKSIGKVCAEANDSPGFISNRLLFALIGEAMWLLEREVAKKEDIDKVMKYGMNHPMGPLKLADFIGLDVCLGIMTYLHKTLSDERYKPPPILEALVQQGKLGKKTGQGFY